MPRQKPGRSRQCYATPLDFIQAIEYRFGPLDFDLAATPKNAKATKFYTRQQNALRQTWQPLDYRFWLNPPYAHISPWASKCVVASSTMKRRGSVFMLVPASVCAGWFRDHVWGKAYVNFLSPRLCFIPGEPYPKDLMLCVYRRSRPKTDEMFVYWNWKTNTIINQKGEINEYRKFPLRKAA